MRKKKRVHVEHGSGLVKGLVWWKAFFANVYDYTLGKLCFSSADQIVAISQGNIPFIKKFSKTPIEVIYRGLDFPEIRRKKQKSDSISLVPQTSVATTIHFAKSASITVVGNPS